MDDDFSAAGDLESRTDEQSTADSASLGVVKQEIKSLNIVRTFVFAFMITMSTITAEVIFVLVRLNEEATCKDDFRAKGNTLIESFHEKLETNLVAIDSFSTSLAIKVRDEGDTDWPFVSFSEFDSRCVGPRRLSQASSIGFAPLVKPEARGFWENYALLEKDQGSLVSNLDMDYQPREGHLHPEAGGTVKHYNLSRTPQEGIYSIRKGEAISYATDVDEQFLFPVWQQFPEPFSSSFRMFDMMSTPVRAQALTAMVERHAGVLSDFLMHNADMTDYAVYSTPRAALYYPIFGSVDKHDVVGAINFEFQWEVFMEDVIDEDVEALVVVVESSCGEEYSFEVQGPHVSYLGEGGVQLKTDSFDPPDPVRSTFEAYQETMATLSKHSIFAAANATEACDFRLRVHATEEFFDSHLTSKPEIYRGVVLGVFLITIGVFLVYDCVVERRSSRVVESARKTDALVSTLFPSDVKKRLLEQAERKRKDSEAAKKNGMTGWQVRTPSNDLEMQKGLIHSPKRKLRSLLGDDMETMGGEESEPIADLFPSASVMFADISGFTAWSSEREPSQVFTLLETLYQAMDKAARRLGIFKVETIGDCYVAACGLPVQREDHIELIVRFARTCLLRSNELTKALESNLGPGTAELALRFGIHSGPVTAGVLRGEKARFQLFGDTMNYAARMESTGLRNKIQLSQASADLLTKRGKPHWVKKRDEKVYAKGKGELQTYWVQLGSSSCSVSGMSGTTESSCASTELSDMGSEHPNVEDHITETVLHSVIGKEKVSKSIGRLVDWNASALTGLLKKVVACRHNQMSPETSMENKKEKGATRSFLNEVEMVISLPSYDKATVEKIHLESVELPQAASKELRSYVASIASGYRKNPFHNFEHASHVILSAIKLLKRMSYADGNNYEDGVTTEDLHEHTYGISSDPLTQFAVVFSALIHDVGHEGIPNGQLAVELPDIAAMYENKSIAEQRSVDVALELLALPKYQNLRNCIYSIPSEEKRFRQLLVNCVLATDIFDPDLKKKRNLRWDQAFHGDKTELTTEDANRKATIVIEHIIQASDVSHTMQHWHIYLKWNERLFQEMYTAYKSGRAQKDPSDGWYKGELWFFDNYVIPLAKKLEECGVFGVSSDEYLTYALQNRAEWEERGEEVCREMIEKCKQSHAKNKGEKIEVVLEDDGDVSDRNSDGAMEPDRDGSHRHADDSMRHSKHVMRDGSQTGFEDH